MIIKKYLPDCYRVKKGENLIQICDNFNLAVDEIKQINMIKSEVKENDLIFLQEHKTNYYIVKPLDTIESVSKKLNVSCAHLTEMNQLSNRYLFIGQKLNY